MQADAAEKQQMALPTLRMVFERAGQTQARVDAWREQLADHELKASRKDAQARDLRRQIDELRTQLARYTESMDEELTPGRERVAQRTRDGLSFERAFTEHSEVLLRHLRTRPECRDLLDEIAPRPANPAVVRA